MRSIFAALLIFGSMHAHADTPAYLSVVSKYTYEEIEQVADYLGVVVENSSPTSKKILSCDAPVAKVSQWLSGPVRELIDQKRATELKAFRENSKSYITRVKGCADRCTCNAYSLMLSEMSEDAESNTYKDLDMLLASESKKLTKEQSFKCARKLSWFCKSKIRTYLLKQ